MPQQVASLSLVSNDATTATFHVHDEDKKDNEEYSKWLVVKAFDAFGQPAAPTGYFPVRWDENTPPADDCDLTAPLPAAASYAAFVTVFPDVWTPRSNTVEF